MSIFFYSSKYVLTCFINCAIFFIEGEQPKTLQWVKLPIVSTEKCKQSGWSDAGITIGDDNICVATETGLKSPCQGDSGGPLVCQKGNNAVITGVVSWGSGCSSSSFKPGIFAKVTYFLDWIKANMVIIIYQTMYIFYILLYLRSIKIVVNLMDFIFVCI